MIRVHVKRPNFLLASKYSTVAVLFSGEVKLLLIEAAVYLGLCGDQTYFIFLSMISLCQPAAQSRSLTKITHKQHFSQ